MPEVQTRNYDASSRRQSAALARERILDAAECLFLGRGFGATTVAAIAAAAEVSAETVYKAYRNKAGIVGALRTRALAGSGPVPAEQRSDAMRTAAGSPTQIIENWARLQTEVMPRVAPILLLVRDAAAGSAEAKHLHEALKSERMKRMLHHSSFLLAADFLRPGLSAQRAADVLYSYTAPELYQILVLEQSWSLEQYRAFTARAMVAALLP